MLTSEPLSDHCHCLRVPQASGYGKVVSHVIIGLKTVKGTKQLKLDPTIYDSLQKEKVQVRTFCKRVCG